MVREESRMHVRTHAHTHTHSLTHKPDSLSARTVSTLKVEKVVSAPQNPVPAASFSRGSMAALTLRAPKTKEPAMLTVVCWRWFGIGCYHEGVYVSWGGIVRVEKG